MHHTTPYVSLKHCEYDAERRVLKLASEYIGMPSQLFVQSHHTGRSILFRPVGENDPLFDPDHWDGEQAIYRPTEPDTRVDHLVIYHQY